MLIKRLTVLLALLASLTAHAATEVITLQHRMAEDVLDVAQTVIGNEGRLAPHGNQLIVNAPASRIAELREVLAGLDTAPRRLLISVETADSASQSDQGYSVNGRVGNDPRGEVRIIRRSTDGQGGGIQQVQAIEGHPALIQAGQSVPVTDSGLDAYGQPYRITRYRNLMRGFYATAEVVGDQVRISLSSQHDRVARNNPGTFELQDTETRVSGRLGEWISVGGLDESARASESGVLQRYATEGRQDYRIRLKVDVLY